VIKNEAGNVLTSDVATVQECAINVPFAETEFQLEFPAGTWVYDTHRGEMYIASASGQKRIITKEELRRGATYEELLVTESGRAALREMPPRAPARRATIVIVNVVVVLSVLAFLLFKFRKRRGRWLSRR
jgi:hypothetical protein